MKDFIQDVRYNFGSARYQLALWILTSISITATVANVYKCSWCFAGWILTNSLWAIHHYKKRQYQQACLFGVYFLLAVWGFISWRGI